MQHRILSNTEYESVATHHLGIERLGLGNSEDHRRKLADCTGTHVLTLPCAWGSGVKGVGEGVMSGGVSVDTAMCVGGPRERNCNDGQKTMAPSDKLFIH